MDDNDAGSASHRRPLIWYFKWVVACYASAFGLFLLVGVACLPVAGGAFLDWWMSAPGNWAMWTLAAALSPFVYRGLR
jgi:hypothetical protein